MGLPNATDPVPALPETAIERRPGRRGRSSTATREMILAAALHEFAERGYEAATTASIARRVGVTQPLVHYHFGSKDALWKSVVDKMFSELASELAAKSQEIKGMGPAARLIATCYAFIDFVVAHPEVSRLVKNDGVTPGPRLTWLVENHIRPVYALWLEAVAEAKGEGVVKDIPDAYVVFAFIGAAHHFFDVAPLVTELTGTDPREPETAKDFADAIVEIFLQGCGRSGELDDA